MHVNKFRWCAKIISLSVTFPTSGHLKTSEAGDEKEQQQLLVDLPTKWDIHGDLVMFPDTSFVKEYWKSVTPEFWKKVANIFDVKRVAVKSRICSDNYRTPKVKPLIYENVCVS